MLLVLVLHAAGAGSGVTLGNARVHLVMVRRWGHVLERSGSLMDGRHGGGGSEGVRGEELSEGDLFRAVVLAVQVGVRRRGEELQRHRHRRGAARERRVPVAVALLPGVLPRRAGAVHRLCGEPDLSDPVTRAVLHLLGLLLDLLLVQTRARVAHAVLRVMLILSLVARVPGQLVVMRRSRGGRAAVRGRGVVHRRGVRRVRAARARRVLRRGAVGALVLGAAVG